MVCGRRVAAQENRLRLNYLKKPKSQVKTKDLNINEGNLLHKEERWEGGKDVRRRDMRGVNFSRYWYRYGSDRRRKDPPLQSRCGLSVLPWFMDLDSDSERSSRMRRLTE